MNPLFAVLLIVASAHGTPQGWGSPGWSGGSPGWSGLSPVDIEMAGVSAAAGEGSAVAEHSSVDTVTGDGTTPAQLYAQSGSGVGLYQSAQNYQQSSVTADGSQAFQSNGGSNSGYAYDFHGVDANGLNINSTSAGWSAVAGAGIVEQADALAHTAGSGWRKS